MLDEYSDAGSELEFQNWQMTRRSHRRASIQIPPRREGWTPLSSIFIGALDRLGVESFSISSTSE